MCIDLLVKTFAHHGDTPCLTRVLADVISGGMRQAGDARDDIAAGLIRGAIRGGRAIGLSPEEAAIVAVESAVLHWSDDADPELTRGAVEAAREVMQDFGDDHADHFARWLGERRLMPATPATPAD